MAANDRLSLAALGQVTALMRAAAEGRLAALRARAQQTEAQRRALDSAAKQVFDPAASADSGAVEQASLHWQRWVEQRRRALLSEESKLHAEIQNQLPHLAIVVGRDETVARLGADAVARQRREKD
ncbi:hypothetical protein [Ketogulonicigenium vulgare]|uniref:hypothetical protein n=1 Tax=Ketogulonicigenium vulgare TaxID=92945 RepID=UPI0023589ED6|nr:hypothetical protein [Ketogulonicigenium vulgare]